MLVGILLEPSFFKFVNKIAQVKQTFLGTINNVLLILLYFIKTIIYLTS